ncbi:MAG: SH3 domain-containing protein [Desulfobulbaceae bacterium]|nr:SH3 domain-containing protein [Desulfobulbaceae bacterium]
MKHRRTKGLLIRTALLMAGMMMTAATAAAQEYVSISKDGVNLRSGPDTKSSVVYELPQGYPLKVMSKQGDWLKVSDFENDQGWVYAPLVTNARYVIVTVNNGNVRSGPGTNHDTVGTVVREVVLKQIGEQGDWIKFEHPQLTGWIHRKLVWP